jgi:hypothetical protein
MAYPYDIWGVCSFAAAPIKFAPLVNLYASEYTRTTGWIFMSLVFWNFTKNCYASLCLIENGKCNNQFI